MKALLDELRNVGVKVVLSSILLMDFHTRQNIWEDIEGHIEARPAFSQFSHYAPCPGTPFYERLKEEGRLLANIPLEEWHAFKRPWFIHPEFSLNEGQEVQEKAYLEDFRRLGPSVARIIRDDLEGYRHMKNSSNPVLKARAQFLAGQFSKYRALLAACERLISIPETREVVREIRNNLESESKPAGAIENIKALGLFGFGKFRQWQTALWGDVIQPRTRLINYQG